MTNPIAESPLLEVACRERRLVHEGVADARIAALLGGAEHPVAAAVLRGDAVTHAIVVGDPRNGDPEGAAVELGMLAEAIGDALQRIS